MALVINKDECIGCGSCASTCPVGAIKEADGKYEIGITIRPTIDKDDLRKY